MAEGTVRDNGRYVAASYVALRLHPHLFDPARVHEWLHPRFREWMQNYPMGQKLSSSFPGWVRNESRDTFSFPLLSDEACRWLMEEVENFHATGLFATPPNTMNKYGLILNDIGLRPSLSALLALYQPLAQLAFPQQGSARLLDHHSFVVSYRVGEDLGLDMHSDDSDVTLNVLLGNAFTGGTLTFCGDLGSPDHRHVSGRYEHERGRALLSLGRRRHGAADITSGHRLSLIMWSYNWEYRQSAEFKQRMQRYLPEAGPPDRACLSHTHDRDYEAVTGLERPNPDDAESSWCPPISAEYEGFKGVAGRYWSMSPYTRLPDVGGGRLRAAIRAADAADDEMLSDETLSQIDAELAEPDCSRELGRDGRDQGRAPEGEGGSRALRSLGEAAALDAESWGEAWHARFNCWYLALPLPTQTQLGGCMGALGLHISSRLDASWRAAQAALGRPPAAVTAFGVEGAAAAEPGCEWIGEGASRLELPTAPEFPLDVDFALPPIPRLLPSWQQLTQLQHRVASRQILSPASVQQASQSHSHSVALSLGAGAGAGVGATLIVGAILFAARGTRRGVRLGVRKRCEKSLSDPAGLGTST